MFKIWPKWKIGNAFFCKIWSNWIFGNVFFWSRMSMDVSGNRGFLSGNRVSFSGNRVSLRRNRVSFSGNRISFSGSRVSFSGNRISLCGNRISFWGNRVSFSGSRISFNGNRAFYFHFQNMFARCPKKDSVFETCLLGARSTCGRVACILHHKFCEKNTNFVMIGFPAPTSRKINAPNPRTPFKILECKYLQNICKLAKICKDFQSNTWNANKLQLHR